MYISLAVPDSREYGKMVGGFREYVRDYIADIQEDSIKRVFQSAVEGEEDGAFLTFNLENFERFGGSYEDSGAAVRQIHSFDVCFGP